MYQILILVYKADTGTELLIFFNRLLKIKHNYSTSSKSSSNYTIPKSIMKLTNFAISRRVTILWNTFLCTILKEIEYLPLFKAKVAEIITSGDSDVLLF